MNWPCFQHAPITLINGLPYATPEQIARREARLVVHCKRKPFDVYIGRPSKWGNPFVISKDGTREEVIEKYQAWVVTQPDLMAALPELRGKVLGCYCSPERCHGHILLALIEGRAA